jgi:predicted AAA+ superfamily ATPase
VAKPEWQKLFPRVERVLEFLEQRLAPERPAGAPHVGDAWAYRWVGRCEPIHHPDIYPLEGLIGVERSVARLRANTAAFVRGSTALDVLLYGERGTGKSSAVRGLLREFGPKGLRLVEVQRDDLRGLSRIYAELRGRDEKFALFCDDLSFEAGDTSYKTLKATLDGGLEERPANVLIIATSNRRHLVPEYAAENREAVISPEGELHPGETAEEKISLSDRFGLLLPFLSFNQETYLAIVDYHAGELGLTEALPRQELHARALRFALDRAGRSGRTARQACIAILHDVDGGVR